MMIIFPVFLIGVIFFQGCVSKNEYNTIIDDRDDCLAEKKLLRVYVDSVESKNELLHNKLVIQKTGTAVMHAHYKELVSVLKSELVAEQITIEEMKSGVVLNLPEKVLFSSGSSELTESGRQMIMKIGAELRFDALYWSFITATTVGYGDIRPSYRTSKILSILIALTGLVFTGIIVAIAVRSATYSFNIHVDFVPK